MLSVVIQHLQTTWTKASRGGEGARQRNLLPLAIELPHFQRAGQFYLHHVNFSERNSFQPEDRKLTTMSYAELKLRVVALEIDETAIRVRYYRDSYNATKPTNYSFKDPFVLGHGEWGRIVYNGRFTDFDTGNWWYEKHVYNIGWFDALERKQFLRTKPASEFEELAMLH